MMHKVFYPFLIIVSVAFSAKAQWNIDYRISRFLFNDRGNERFGGYFGHFLASPNFNISHPNYFILAQLSEPSVKNKLADKLKRTNYAGIAVENGLVAGNILNTGKFDIVFLFNNVYRQELRYPGDFFELMFYGNSPFAGKSMELSPFSLKNYFYNELRVDFNHSTEEIKKFGFGFSLLQGSQFNELSLKNSSFFTSSEGDSISASLNFCGHFNNPAVNQLFNVNGFGMAFNAFYSIKKNKSAIYIAVENVGAIFWNKKSRYFAMDTSFSYTGFGVFEKNPFNSLNFGLFTDTFLNLKNISGKQSYKMFLPPRLIINHLLSISGASLFSGIVYEACLHQIPTIFSTIRKPLWKSVTLQSGICFDSYRKAGLLLNLNIQCFKNVSFSFGTNHLEGMGISKIQGQQFFFNLLVNSSNFKE